MLKIYCFFLIGFTGMILHAAPGQAGTGTPGAQPQPAVLHSPLPNTPQTLSCGLWRTDEGFVSTIHMKNVLITGSLDVTPVLYTADGTELVLPSVRLPAAGVMTLNVNDRLAVLAPGLAAHLSAFGSAALRFNGLSSSLLGSILILNEPASLSYSIPFNAAMQTGTSPQILEGVWWRRDPGGDGWVAVSNSTGESRDVTIQAVTSRGRKLAPELLKLSPHQSQMLALQSLTAGSLESEHESGGLRVAFSGWIGDVNMAGELVNYAEGYSALMPFWMTGMSMAADTLTTIGHVGLMTGSPDPMMNFPKGTHFAPYLVLRNITAREINISLTVFLANGAALHARDERLHAWHSRKINMDSLLTDVGLKNYSGSINLVTSHSGQSTDIIEAAGSVDDTGTYVFEVEGKTVGTSRSKEGPYWSVSNGFDTMVSLWNSGANGEDVVVRRAVLYLQARMA